MLYTLFNPEIALPPATVSQLLKYQHENKSLMAIFSFFMITFASLSMILCVSFIKYPDYFSFFMYAIFVNGAFILALSWIETNRDYSRSQISPLDDRDTVELASLLASTQNADILRYAAEVKAMGRTFRNAELQAIQVYARMAVNNEATEKAKQFLYH